MTATPPAGRPGRPRSEQTHQAILEATQEVLREVGYGGLSLDEIARRAKVGKRTIYRWWSSKGALVAEAFREDAARRHPTVDTGTVHGDLVSYLSALFSDVSSPGKKAALSSMMAEAQTGGDFAADFDQFIEDRRTLVRDLLERGVRRGEIAPDTDLDLSVDVLFGVFWYRVLTGDRPLDPAVAHALVAGLLQATRPA
ncbi:TetR/AcrR family transcriptional regulator [Actinacidiphila bryophytorum]|uniref:TetR/AcrR family transcriptional regulator n=1 Tax=Actinacidiphila bryophytorum TaxID=1436133 RepID=UPI002176BFC6|nr:TetR/AcrR family transcriptional regulator [Actinacidiphila bryophytorum]UWE10322.1 TetR/AcrR family transcriptional regulator [Actinacidiphila bryophytorum]